MMGLDDFSLSVLAGLLANKIDLRKLKGSITSAQTQETVSDTNEALANNLKNVNQPKKFKTFDAWTDLDNLLKVVKEPLISILIENQPSTNYRLPSLVLESRITREWYVFHRGRMSFEGNGSGLRNSEVIFKRLKTANVLVGIWILDQTLLDRLDNGHELWPVIQSQAVPFLAAPSSDYSWSEIQQNITKITESNPANY